MNLSSALYGATAGVSNASAQIAVVSRNIANQSNPNASRKIANVVTTNGLPSVVSISQASNSALLTSLLSANSKQSQQSAISTAMSQLEGTLGTSASDTTSPSALIGQLSNALQTYAVSPQSPISAQAAVIAATNLANGLNNASTTVQSVREQADSGIADSVTKINDTLTQFTQVNQTVVAGTATGADVTDAVDQRNSLLQQLSNQIGITTIRGADNDIKIYTDSGLTLFDQSPMQGHVPADARLHRVHARQCGIRGWRAGDGSGLTVQSPKRGACRLGFGPGQSRDDLSIAARSDRERVDHVLPGNGSEQPSHAARAGRPFTNGGSLTVPSTGTGDAGPRGEHPGGVVCEHLVGEPSLLRDGGISSNGAAPYVYNPSPGQAGYSDRLNQLVSNLSQSLTFDTSAGAGTQSSVTDYASASASWLGTQASQASNAASYSAAVQSTASTALSNATGVNLDTELSHMLALEQSYQASAKLMTTVSTLYSALFAAISVGGRHVKPGINQFPPRDTQDCRRRFAVQAR